MWDETTKELNTFQLQYTTLDLCPDEFRASRPSIARWKNSMREKYSRENGVPHVLTIGDQWSDLFPMPSEASFKRWDRTIPPERPVALVEIKNPVTAYGLKLQAFD